MLALILLAQVATAATPVATPTPAAGATAGSVSAAPRTLADVARERKQGKKGVEGGTLSVAGQPGSPEQMPRESSASANGSASPATARIRAAEAEVRAARIALDESATRTGLTSEVAAAMRARLLQARKELAEAYEAAARSRN